MAKKRCKLCITEYEKLDDRKAKYKCGRCDRLAKNKAKLCKAKKFKKKKKEGFEPKAAS